MNYSTELVKAFLEKFGTEFNARDNPKLFLYFDGHETDHLTPEDYQTIELKLIHDSLHAKITYLESEITKDEAAEPYKHEDDYFIPIRNLIEIKLERKELDLSTIE